MLQQETVDQIKDAILSNPLFATIANHFQMQEELVQFIYIEQILKQELTREQKNGIRRAFLQYFNESARFLSINQMN